MTLRDSLTSAKATGLTVALNFWPWLLATFLIGAALGGFGAFKVTQAFYRGEAAEAREQLVKFEASIAARAAETQALARQLEVEARDQEAARQAAIMDAIATGWQQVLGQVRRDNLLLREAINAPIYDCLRTAPLPGDYLRVLTRPGGAVPAGDHQDPGAPAAP
jgi:hypothetical protein